MKLFICAVPLFDSEMTVQAYRLRARSAENIFDIQNAHCRMVGALQSPEIDLVEKVGIEAFASDKPLFIDINQYQLLTGKPADANINPEQLVCVLPGGVAAEAAILDRCRAIKQMGYRLALDDFPLGGMQSPFFEYADYLIMDCSNRRFPDIYRTMRGQLPRIAMVVTDIASTNQFDQLRENQAALFTGSFYNQPITAGVSTIAPVKINALQLMKQVNEPDFELADIVKIVERDPALSISLLRFINASKGERKIASIQSAVAIMGQQEVRQWASAALSVSLGEDRPGEITRLSLIRARFAENLAGAFQLGVFQQSLFMAGLFSLLDVILQQPMDRALGEVAVDEKVRLALVDKTGELYPVINLIFAYERAEWDLVSRIMIQNNVPVEEVNRAFVEALTWYYQMLAALDTHAFEGPNGLDDEADLG